MAQDPLGGGGGGLPTRRTFSMRDDEEIYLQQQIERYAGRMMPQAQQPAQTAISVLRQPDPITSVLDSIWAIGGPGRYSQMVDAYGAYWRAIFNSAPHPEVVLDFGRAPMPLSSGRFVLREVAHDNGLYRGAQNEGDNVPFLEGLRRGVMKLFGGTWAEETRKDIDALYGITDSWRYTMPYEFLTPPKTGNVFTPPKGATPIPYRQELYGIYIPNPAWAINTQLQESFRVKKIEKSYELLNKRDFWGSLALVTNVSNPFLGPLGLARYVIKHRDELEQKASDIGGGPIGLGIASMETWGSAWATTVGEVAQAVGWVGSGASEYVLKPIGRGVASPIVASTGYIYASSPQVRAVVDTLEPVVELVAEIAKQNAEAIKDFALLPVKAVEKGFESLTTAESAVLFGTYYLYKYAFQNESTLDALLGPLPGHISTMPPGGPGDPEWDDWHLAQQTSPWDYMVTKTADELAKGHMFGTTALQYAGVPVEQMPMTSFMTDLMFYTAMDAGIGGGVKSIGKAAKVPQLVDLTLRKTGWVQEIGDVIAATKNTSKIQMLTGIWDQRALDDLAAAGTREEVQGALRKWIVQGGMKVKPGDLLLERQMKTAFLQSKFYQSSPRIVKMAMSVMPDSVPGLRLDDARINDSAHAVGAALGLSAERTFYYADRAIRAPWREQRYAILDEMFKEGISANPQLFVTPKDTVDDLMRRIGAAALEPDPKATITGIVSGWTDEVYLGQGNVGKYVDDITAAADEEGVRVAVLGMIEDAKGVWTDEYQRALDFDRAKMLKGKAQTAGRAYAPHPWEEGVEMSLRDQQQRLLRVRQQLDQTQRVYEEIIRRQQLSGSIRKQMDNQARLAERLGKETTTVQAELTRIDKEIVRNSGAIAQREIADRARELLDTDFTDDIAQWLAENRGIDELDLLAYDSRIKENIPNWNILVRRGVIREAPKAKKKLAGEATVSWAKADERVTSGLDELAERIGLPGDGHPEWGIGVDPTQANPTDELVAWLQNYVGVKERRQAYKVVAEDSIKSERAKALTELEELKGNLTQRLEALKTDPEAARRLLESDILSTIDQESITKTITDYEELVAGFQREIDEAKAQLDELDEAFAIEGTAGEARVFQRAQDLATADREYDKLIYEFVNSEGGIRPGGAHGFDPALSEIENQRQWRNLANPTAPRDLTEMADAVRATFPAYGIKTGDDMWEWLRGNKPPDPQLYVDQALDALVEERNFFKYPQQRAYLVSKIDNAEKTLERHTNYQGPRIQEAAARLLQHVQAEQTLAQRQVVLEAYEPFRRTVEEGIDLLDAGRIVPEPEVEATRLKMAGLDSLYRKLVNEPSGRVPVPLHPYQITQYWTPDIPLETVFTHMGGSRLMRSLDELSAGFIKLGGDKFMYMGVMAPDKLIAMWKKYALGSVGILTRIALDEPLRMLSLGYGPEALISMTGYSRSQRALKAGDILLGEQAYADQLVETSLRYIMEEVSPVTHITFTPDMPGWTKAASHTLHTLQQQPTTQVWMNGGAAALRRWGETAEGRHFLERRGTTLDEWVEQNDEFLFQMTHTAVTDRKAVPMGLLTAAQQDEWSKYSDEWYGWFDETLRPPVLLDKRVGEIVPEDFTRDPLDLIGNLSDYDQRIVRQYVEYAVESGEPPVLWHATVDIDGVRREGLKTQVESGMVGLGGTPNWVSVTYSESFAQSAAQRMRIQTLAAKDMLDYEDILDQMDRDYALLMEPWQVASALDLADTADMPLITYINNLDDDEAWRVVYESMERQYPGPEGKHALVSDIDSYYLTQAYTWDEQAPEGLGVGMLRSFEDTLRVDENKIGVVQVAARREPQGGVAHITGEFELRFSRSDDVWVAEPPIGADRAAVESQFYEGMRRPDRIKLENLRGKQIGRLTGKRPDGTAAKQYRYPFKATVGKADEGGVTVRVLGPAGSGGDEMLVVEFENGTREVVSAEGLYRMRAKGPLVTPRPPLRPRTNLPLSPEAAAGAPTPPTWIDPAFETVRNGRLYRRHDSLHYMLKGDMAITDRTLNAIPAGLKPIIQGRRPKGALVNAEGFMDPDVVKKNPIGQAYDAMYGMFDGMMKNVRTTIFAREYKREREALERAREIAAKDGRIISDDELHVLAREHAQSMVDKITYNATRTGLEYAFRDIIPFAPATRDFIGFWGREVARKPSRGLLYARMQEMPSEVTVDMNVDTVHGLSQLLAAGGVGMFGGMAASAKAGAKGPAILFGIGGAALEGMAFSLNSKHPRQMVFNPRTATFFTGGAGAEGNEGFGAWQLLSTNFPGVSPLLTVPAGYLATSFPEKFGPFPEVSLMGYDISNADLAKVPGFELATKQIPMSSRTERLAFALGSLVAAAITGVGKGEAKWYIPNLESLPWIFGRNPEARTRSLDMITRYMAGTGDYDIDNPDPDVSAKETERMLSDASKELWTHEFWAAVTGEFLPTIFYLRDAEQHDFEQAIGAYKKLFYLPPQNPTPLQEAHNQTNQREKDISERERQAIRDAYPEYEAAFDWMDAREAGDQEALLAAGQKDPRVVGQMVALYDASESLATMSEDSLEQWLFERGRGLHEIKHPEAYAQEVSAKYRRKAEWEETATLLTQFEKQMTADGFDPKSQEWKVGRQAIIEDQKRKWGSQSPQTVYTKMSGTDIGQMGQAEEKAEDNWKKERARILELEMQDQIEGLKDSDPTKKFIVGKYRRLFEREELTWPGGEPSTQFEIEMADIEAFVSLEPWGMTEAEAEAHGLRWSPQLENSMAQALEARQMVDEWLTENNTSFWTTKASNVRAGYKDFIAKLCMSSDDFADAWEYYQAPKWERLRDSGELSSPTWSAWFDALAQRDEWIDGKAQEKTGEPNSGYFSMTEPNSTTAKVFEGLWAYADQLASQDPAWAEEFNAFSPSFWNKERRW